MSPEHPLIIPLVAGLAVGWALEVWLQREASRLPLAARRLLQLLSLALPVLLGGFVWWHLWEDAGALDWAMRLGFLCTSGLAVVAVATGVLRHIYLARLLHSCSETNGCTERIQQMVDELALGLGMKTLPVRCLPASRPVALVVGLDQAVLYLSSWYALNLTDCQLRLVVAHELAHAARKDNLVGIWAWGLALGGWYSPSSWRTLWALLRERELAADELAARTSGDPVSLAKILVRVFEQFPSPHGLPTSAFERRAFLEERIERLLAPEAGNGSGAEIAQAGSFGWRFWGACAGLVAIAYLGINALPHLWSLL